MSTYAMIVVAIAPPMLEMLRVYFRDAWVGAAIYTVLFTLLGLAYVTSRSKQRRRFAPLQAILDRRLVEPELVYLWNERVYLAGRVQGRPVHFELVERDEFEPSEFRVASATDGHPFRFSIKPSFSMVRPGTAGVREFACAGRRFTLQWLRGPHGEAVEERVARALERPGLRRALESLLEIPHLARIGTETLPDGSGGTFFAIQMVCSPYLRRQLTADSVRAMLRQLEALHDALREHGRNPGNPSP